MELDVFADRLRDDDDALEAADFAVRLPEAVAYELPDESCCPELAELTLLASPDFLGVLPPPFPVVVLLAILLILVDDAVLLDIEDFVSWF